MTTTTRRRRIRKNQNHHEATALLPVLLLLPPKDDDDDDDEEEDEKFLDRQGSETIIIRQSRRRRRIRRGRIRDDGGSSSCSGSNNNSYKPDRTPYLRRHHRHRHRHHRPSATVLTAAYYYVVVTILISFYNPPAQQQQQQQQFQQTCYSFSLGGYHSSFGRNNNNNMNVNNMMSNDGNYAAVRTAGLRLFASSSSSSSSGDGRNSGSGSGSQSGNDSRGRKRGRNNRSSKRRRKTSSSSSLNDRTEGGSGRAGNSGSSKQSRRKGIMPSSPSPVADLFTTTRTTTPTPSSLSSSQAQQRQQNQRQDLPPVSSLLPPPIKRGSSSSRSSRSTSSDSTQHSLSGCDPTSQDNGDSNNSISNGDDDNLQLSSWDDVMIPPKRNGGKTASSSSSSSSSSSVSGSLPSIADLFPPPDLPSQSATNAGTVGKGKNNSLQNQRQGRQTILAPSKIFKGLSGYDETTEPPPSMLEGAMDIGDIFFNPNRSAKTNRNNLSDNQTIDNVQTDGINGNDTKEVGDDEELPFSVEQSDQLSTYHNKMKSRDGINDKSSNNEKVKLHKPKRARRSSSSSSSSSSGSSTSSSSRPRKRAVRRGLEMLVDGVPISADPPQRSIELYYTHNRTVGWQKVITTNSRDFGPINHYQSVNMLSKEELGLFCEYFVDSTLRSNVCPKDLRGLARGFSSKMERSRGKRMTPEQDGGRTRFSFSEHASNSNTRAPSEILKSLVQMNKERLEFIEKISPLLSSDGGEGGRGGRGFGKPSNKGNNKEIPLISFSDDDFTKELSEALGIDLNQSNERLLSRMVKTTDESALDELFQELATKNSFSSSPRNRRKAGEQQDDAIDPIFTSSSTASPSMEFEFVFSFAVSKTEIESFDVEGEQPIFEKVLMKGLKDATNYTNYEIVFSQLKLVDNGDGTTMVFADFDVVLEDSSGLSLSAARKELGHIGASLSHAIDEGGASEAWAAAAMNETTWPLELRTKLAQEFQLDDVDDDDDDDDDEGEDEDDYEYILGVGPKDVEPPSTVDQPSFEPSSLIPKIESDGAAAMSIMKDLNSDSSGTDTPNPGTDDDWYGGSSIRLGYDDTVTPDTVSSGHSSDIFFGSGKDGVFPNYDAGNAANAPYGGKLGLRLVDAAVERAKQRHPRVIAIGDVHGCIDELQELLRECDYRPGDLVVFLGDLVSKGPDSLSVVQLAREIGAIGVRGNHDYEVIRWAQAIKSGIDPPQARSDHYRIATKLSTADLKWMHALPWYIHSHDLEALFVHAGFVSGIRLAKQNPRLMMNMRSILPDGTVTSKFFNNWPWARLWDGPQTVLFGHDADRGLQQYEHAMGLDTGCCYGGRLTACILPEKRLVSVPAKREYFQYRRKHYD